MPTRKDEIKTDKINLTMKGASGKPHICTMVTRDELYFNSLPYSQIKLNDFMSFDYFLFGAEKRDWATFLDFDGNFIPPIANPISIVQHQLCHYAFWMTIAKNNLYRKPRIPYGAYVPSLCYACKYADLVAPSVDQCNFCPLERDTSFHCCGKEHSSYMDCTLSDSSEASKWAAKVAKMIWRNPILSNPSLGIRKG